MAFNDLDYDRAEKLTTENACQKTIIERLKKKVTEQDRQLRLLKMPKDNVIVLMQENASQRKHIADLTRDLGLLQAKYNRDVHGEPND